MISMVSVSLLLGLFCGLETFGAEFGKFSDINKATTTEKHVTIVLDYFKNNIYSLNQFSPLLIRLTKIIVSLAASTRRNAFEG